VDVTAASTTTDEVMAAAFRSLLRDERPPSAADLAADLGCDAAEVEAALGELERRGRIRRDEHGWILGSAGLSVVPTEHEVSLRERTVWTWCAKVALGVLGTVGTGGRVTSRCAQTGRPVQVDFDGPEPKASDLAVFWPSREFGDSCRSAVEQLCPNINFFESAAAAETWTAAKDVPGEVLSVEAATVRAIDWADELGLREERPAAGSRSG
jgi:alkylmercury lyase